MSRFNSLIGQKLIWVEFENQSLWRFHFGNGAEIRPGVPWRVISDRFIQTSSEDHGQKYGLPEPINAVRVVMFVVGNSAVYSVDIFPGTLDLKVHFDNGTRLEIIPFSSGYESWQYIGPDGQHVIAQGGGEILSLPSRSEQ